MVHEEQLQRVLEEQDDPQPEEGGEDQAAHVQAAGCVIQPEIEVHVIARHSRYMIQKFQVLLAVWFGEDQAAHVQAAGCVIQPGIEVWVIARLQCLHQYMIQEFLLL